MTSLDQLRRMLDHENPVGVVADLAEECGACERHLIWLRAVAARPGQRPLGRGRVYAAANDRAEEMAVWVLNQMHSAVCIQLGMDGYDPPEKPESV